MNWIKNIMNKFKTNKVVSPLKTNDYIAPKNTELDAIVRSWVSKK